MKTISKETLLHQEIVNSISHGAGLLFGIISIPYLIAIAIINISTTGVFAAYIYGFGFLMAFTFSTLYHSFKQPRKKYILTIFDHISIYFLIAGAYTPFTIIYVNNSFGMSLLAALWSLTLMGIFFKVFYTGRFENLSTAIYLLMGMLLLAGGKTFFAAMPVNVVELIIAGGVLYATGVLFYVWKKYTYHHGVWHLFLLAATICHYVAVLKTIGYQ